jgi:glucosyl-3-phosphoglycerate synthase
MASPPDLPTFHHSHFAPALIAAQRDHSVSVCLPTRECASTIGPIVGALCAQVDLGTIDDVVVIDANSADATAEVARAAGAQVHQEADLCADFGPCLGKGDAMWRALTVLSGDVIVYLDADNAAFGAHYVTGLLGPIVCERSIDFVKAFYHRPFHQAGISLPHGGGRVNHLLARPVLSIFYPQLASIRQPLAGEVAAKRTLLEALPFASGYGVEVAMLIDAFNHLGASRIAQVDLDLHLNDHQPLPQLAKMSSIVMATIARRLAAEGRLQPDDPATGTFDAAGPERPPLATLVT